MCMAWDLGLGCGVEGVFRFELRATDDGVDAQRKS